MFVKPDNKLAKPNNKLMAGRVVLVTGASRGIGAATAKLLASQGAAVAINYHSSSEAAASVLKEIQAEGGKGLTIQADVKDEAQVAAMVRQVSETFGSIDTIVLNASIKFVTASFEAYQWSDFEAKLVGEIKAAFNCCKAVTPTMIERGKGCIIAVSSAASRLPKEGLIAHNTAKSGIDAFVKSLALELGPHGIRVNAVAPGLTQTDTASTIPEAIKDTARQMTPLRKLAKPDDIAKAILLLASSEANFITGAYLPVSGGIQML
ncbi:SDR family NAD(P)-dependent oxidoreductase [Myxosarcina sp. GI1]|uniref:SDR family NAD(P)-dependent oxidoreductase n=1 Tax=Myxosarcina sp. GI1 TaxID=1541065 RepID=UPI001C0F57F8|nr:SDR family oxidoreductase [Myxosarcina sp. GI1]